SVERARGVCYSPPFIPGLLARPGVGLDAVFSGRFDLPSDAGPLLEPRLRVLPKDMEAVPSRSPPLHDEEFRRAIEQIKLRAPIEDVVRERVPGLKKAGSAWTACCPFHEERTPSFRVDPRRGTWHCFGACGTGGDQISFLERFENLSFMDALE